MLDFFLQMKSYFALLTKQSSFKAQLHVWWNWDQEDDDVSGDGRAVVHEEHNGQADDGTDSYSQFHQHFRSNFFVKKLFFEAFMCLQFVFLIFCWKKIGIKAARKMLVKLTLAAKSR